MPFFADNRGRQWRVRVTYQTVRDVRDALFVDLLRPHVGSPPLHVRLRVDDVLFCNVLFVACEREAEMRGVGAAAFGKALRGGLMPAVKEALFEAWAEFFPRPSTDPSDEVPPVKPSEYDECIWRAAGVVGVDPSPFTFREIIEMAEGANRQQWHHTTACMAMIANANRRRHKPFTPADFDPYRPQKKPPKVSMRFVFDMMQGKPNGRTNQNPN